MLKYCGTYYEGNNSWRESLWDKYYMHARTTEAIRREIRNSEESIAKAAKRFNVNPKTIIKWRKREDTKDLAMGPKKIKSTVLFEAEEGAIVAFRKMTQNYRWMICCISYKK
jgi:transposase